MNSNYCTCTSEEAAAKAEAAAKDLSSQQGVAVLGLALVAMGEDIGSEMLFRHFGHLLRYEEFHARIYIPYFTAVRISYHKCNTQVSFSRLSDIASQ